MTDFSQVNKVLGFAIDRGDVPGVVAMAATRDEVVYQSIWAANASRGSSDEHRHGVLDRLHDQGHHLGCGHAAC